MVSFSYSLLGLSLFLIALATPLILSFPGVRIRQRANFWQDLPAPIRRFRIKRGSNRLIVCSVRLTQGQIDTMPATLTRGDSRISREIGAAAEGLLIFVQ